MSLTIACSSCGAKLHVPENALGRSFKCPKCGNGFTLAALASLPPDSPIPPIHKPPPVLSASPSPSAVNRTILAQLEATIRYSCPRCKKSLESPASLAGQKLNCPDCGQRLQIPETATPATMPIVNKTSFAKDEPFTSTNGRPQPAATEEKARVAPRRYPRRLILFGVLGGTLMVLACGGLAWWLLGGKASPQAAVSRQELHDWATRFEARRKVVYQALVRGDGLPLGRQANEDILRHLKDLNKILTEIDALGSRDVYPASTRTLMKTAEEHMSTLERMLGIGTS